jgi:hypothetical protein
MKGPSTPLGASRLVRIGAFLLFNVIFAVVVMELVIVTMLAAPSAAAALPRRARVLFQQVYRHFNRSIIQFEPSCAHYDAELTYTLKPGQCTFSNVEFTTELRINRAGLRDDDSALEAPDVIVLGDSYTMGWGVQQEETLSRVLARTSGLKVLNAGISSYGTVRELKLLDRLDTSRMKFLVVQYNQTDLVENVAFREHGGTIPILAAEQYQASVDRNRARQGYWPGKYMSGLFGKLSALETLDPNAPTAPAAMSSLEEATLFVDVLARGAKTPLDEVQVIVFEASEQIRPPRPFLANVAVISRGDGQPAYVRRLRLLDVAPLLEEQDFYSLDDHLRASGHEKIGRALAEVIKAS